MSVIIQESDDFSKAFDESTKKEIIENIFNQKLRGIKVIHNQIEGNYMRLYFENEYILEATWGTGDFNSYLELEVTKLNPKNKLS